jgi:succinyl-diaminopimelate desuccinylase
MEAYVKAYPLPDYGFTPDGSFPICNIEKGGMDLELIIPADRQKNFGDQAGTAAGAQAGKALLESIESGKAVNVVPGECRAVIRMPDGTDKQLETKGQSVHSCQPEKGVNALVEMGKEIRSMLESGILEPTRGAKFLAMLGERFASTEGEALGLYSETEYYQGEFVHRNVFSPTLAYTSDQAIHVNINARFPYGSDEEKIREIFRNLAEEFGGRMEEKGYMPAVYVRKDRPFLKAFDQAYERVMGESGGYNLEYGGTYAKAIPDVVSWGPIFPGEEDTCHEENEYIGVDSLVKNAKIFALAMANIAFTEDSFR